MYLTELEILQNWQAECRKQKERRHEVFHLHRVEKLELDEKLAKLFDREKNFDRVLWLGHIEVGRGGRTRRRM